MKVRLALAAWVAAGAVAALVAGLGGTAQAALAHPETAAPPVLYVQSCTGGSFCLATGTYSKPGERYAPLAEEWNGKTWRIFPGPSGFWGPITCTGLSFCLASGRSPQGHNQEDVWNGKTWRKFTALPPNPFVLCVSPDFCVALNDDEPPSGEMYWTGGSQWQAMPGTSAGCGGAWCDITSLNCVSATNCQDAGNYCGDSDCDDGTYNYTDVWNGLTWTDSTSQPGPGFGGMQACAGRAFCLTLNPPRQAAITNDWGNSWHSASAHLTTACRHLVRCISPGLLACGSPWFCLALPAQHPVGSLVWNGTEWGFARLALVSGHLPKFTNLSCGSSRNCVATGTYQLSARSTPRLVAEHWNGKAWQVTQLVVP
jgi:hypothetical protein